MTIFYTLTPSNPAAHIFTVQLIIDHSNPDGHIITLPTWIPGSYMIREFSKNIVSMVAWNSSDNSTIEIERLDKQTWKLHCAEPCMVEYEIYAWDLSVRMAHLDQNHGYCNGTSVFLAVKGFEHVLHQVQINAPEDGACQDWQVATTLRPLGDDRRAFGVFEALDYDDLIDHPIEMGHFTLLTFESGEVQHEIALTGKFRCDQQKLIRDLKTICDYEVQFFGSLPKMSHYLFQIMVVGNGYGGLEHRSSTSLITSRYSLPLDASDQSDDYISFLGLVSHEYFHTWNVKQIKPAVFSPYDLTQEAYTSLLWVFEGWTSYYDDLILLRSGLIDTSKYLELIGKNITRVYKGSGLYKQSLAESSLTTWTKFYRQDENSVNAIVSYYAKGALAAMALDLHLRLYSEITLDTVMKALWERFGSKGIGVPEDGVEALTMELSGLDLRDWFDDVVRGTGMLPLAESLEAFGVKLSSRRPTGPSDLGGKAAKVPLQGGLGLSYKSEAGGIAITQVFDGGAGQAAGLSAGDVLIAFDGIKVSTSNIQKILKRYSVGDIIEIHGFRRDELFTSSLRLQLDEEYVYYLEIISDLDESTLKKQEEWLCGK